MSLFYEDLASEASELIKEFGRPIVFRRTTGATVDPLASTVTGGTVVETTLSGTVIPASAGTLEAFDVRFMSDVQAGTDVRFAIVSVLDINGAPAAFQPGPGDEAIFAGRTWQLMGNTPLNVDGTPVIYSIGFKGP
jgi:hypothetical protein